MEHGAVAAGSKARSKRFKVAFSFAGEKRDFVAKVAGILAERLSEDAILYDKYHEAEFARADLGIYLPKLYGEQSDLIVPVLCPAYDQKRWTGWEWLHIYGLLTNTDMQRVMPCRFEHAEADGLSPAAGFVELDHKTPEQVAILILERLALNEGNPKDHYIKIALTAASRLDSLIPHNLPRLQPFFGREEELKKIAVALDPESRTFGALIDGPGGMGKTSLAVRAAYDAVPNDFKQIIFVSLKTRELDDDGVRDLSGFILSGLVELYNEIARELGRDDLTKVPEDERPRLLLDALRGMNALLVLDNLESLVKTERDQLFTFVKRLPQGCKAILTARGRIGSGAEELILEKLSQKAAVETLAELATHNPVLAGTTEAERIVLYTQTAGNPLLLRWTAGQLGRGNCRTFTDALNFLRSCPPGNDPLEFIFGDLVEDFTPAETKVLSALSYFTLPAKIEHVAAVAGLPEGGTALALSSLANRSLALPSDELQSFTLIPMVADFLRKTRPQIVQKTGVHLEERALALIIDNGFEKHERFPALDRAWPTVAAALPRFLLGPNKRLQIACDAMGIFLHFSGRWDEAIALARQAESVAITEGDLSNAGWRMSDAANIHALRGESKEVLICAERAAAHWRNAKAGPREQAIAIRLRGVGYEIAKDYVGAITAYRQAVAEWRTLGAETRDVAVGLADLADAEMGVGDVDAAERDYREAIRLARGVGSASSVATYTGNLAAVALKRGDWQGAEACSREALAMSENVGRKDLIASDCQRLSEALIRQRKGGEALPYAQRAVDMFEQLTSPYLEAARATLRLCEKLIEEAQKDQS